jgi:hypothetical protein
MMLDKTLNDFLAELGPMDAKKNKSVSSRSSVTFWLPPDIKSRYDRLQEISGRRFGKSVREALLALIGLAEARAA